MLFEKSEQIPPNYLSKNSKIINQHIVVLVRTIKIINFPPLMRELMKSFHGWSGNEWFKILNFPHEAGINELCTLTNCNAFWVRKFK